MRRRRFCLSLPVLVLGAIAAAPLAAQPLVPLGEEVRLTPEETCGHLAPDVAWTSDGGLVTVWSTFPEGIVARLAPPPGLDHGPQTTLVEGAFVPSAVAPASGGGFWLVWGREAAGGEELALQRFTGDGAALGRPIVAAFRAGGTAPAIAALADGAVAVAWDEFTEERVRVALQRFAADGTPLGGEIEVLAEAQPALAAERVVYLDVDLAGGPAGLLVVWARGRFFRGQVQQTMARAFDPGGEALGEAVAMTPFVPRVGQPGAAVTSAGFLAGWAAPEGAGAAAFVGRLDLAGRPTGEAVRISEPGGIFLGPRLAADGARAVAAWSEAASGRRTHAVLRPLDAAGQPAGPAVPLHRPLDEGDGLPHAVARVALAAEAGRLAAAWQLFRATPILPSECDIGYAIFGRGFRTGGRPQPGPGWRPRSPSWPSGGRGSSP